MCRLGLLAPSEFAQWRLNTPSVAAGTLVSVLASDGMEMRFRAEGSPLLSPRQNGTCGAHTVGVISTDDIIGKVDVVSPVKRDSLREVVGLVVNQVSLDNVR